MPRGFAKSADLRRIAAGEEPLLFGSLYKNAPRGPHICQPAYMSGKPMRCTDRENCPREQPGGIFNALPRPDSTPGDSPTKAGTVLARARSFMRSIRGWLK